MQDLDIAPSSARVKDLEKVGAGRQAEIYVWPGGGVVKLFRSSNDGAAARREAASMCALQATAIPMPRIFGAVSIEHRPGIVVERLAGADQLSLLGRKPWLILTTATNLAKLHVQLHSTIAPEQLLPLKPRSERRSNNPTAFRATASNSPATFLIAFPMAMRFVTGTFTREM